METWRAYFEQNRAERLPVDWAREITLPDALRGPLVRSLQRFQVGESGDGAHLKAGAAKTGNADYQAAIALFVGEEQEHAAWLARIIEKTGGSLLAGHWSDGLFVLLRRVCGLRVELMVLMVAEMIAVRYYRALHEGVPDPTCAQVFAQIRRDEFGHVAFHIAVLQGVFAPRPLWLRFVVRTVWHALFAGACLVVMLDHRGVLRATGVSGRVFWRDAHRIFKDTADPIFDPAFARVPALVNV